MDPQSLPSDIPSLARTIFANALNQRASDVHMDPTPAALQIRFRIDGSLNDYVSLPMSYHEQLMTHLKVLSELNTTAVFTPQDGHFAMSFAYSHADSPNVTTETLVDMRVSIFPTVYGDAAVFRLASAFSRISKFEELGMNQVTMEKLHAIIKKNNGMTIITGPVGSGKTSTLYSCLDEVLTKDRVAITLEDPVEFRFDKVRQVQMNAERGLTYAQGMKAILRQDPDIILIGEIRDAETAEYAIRAALVGRTVFTTLHTNSCIGTIARLLDMNIERSLIAYAVNGVMASRLVKRNCEACLEDYTPPKEYLVHFGLDNEHHVYKRGAGCQVCQGKGYRGRIGIFEVLEFDTELRSMIVEGASMADLEKYVAHNNKETLIQDALGKVFAGVTTLENIATVL